jgi:hypothetical protein
MVTLHLPDPIWQQLSHLATLQQCDPSDCVVRIIQGALQEALDDQEDYTLGIKRLSEGGTRYTLQQVLQDDE